MNSGLNEREKERNGEGPKSGGEQRKRGEEGEGRREGECGPKSGGEQRERVEEAKGERVRGRGKEGEGLEEQSKKNQTHCAISLDVQPHNMNSTLSELLSTVHARCKLSSSCLQFSKSAVVGLSPPSPGPSPGSWWYIAYTHV